VIRLDDHIHKVKLSSTTTCISGSSNTGPKPKTSMPERHC